MKQRERSMLTKEQIMSVKARGFLRNRGTDCFSGRVVTVAGVFTPDELRTVAECAERFGSGKVGFTSRLSAEIVGIPFDKIDGSIIGKRHKLNQNASRRKARIIGINKNTKGKNR